ncbi:cellulose synthase operon protein YhjQ [Pusillimonas sp. CC-YST705]|uniref:Cellulose synthase operon protein YhjQ n=1 Tax=Mesopusillimonas faecipullorum TaxID=2755040 RepID=A0ABS8CEV0_9BURK|nr:cellulose biosynthesis protein BcsQ [Mesopusillimonas faecipullorum]MCB5364538.1 cellulose synthase operon protein YhjQ [Mesopusillimonas faecipullorum]
MKKVAIVSAKGGVGKSTISASLGMALLRTGHPVLGIDLDPQNSLRLHLGEHDYKLDGLSRATLEGRDWRQVGHQLDPGFTVLPYGHVNETDRRKFETLLATDPAWLSRNLEKLPLVSETTVIIDTPPGPSVYLQQALSAADIVIIVTLADAASYATLPQMDKLISHYCTTRADFLGYAFLINQYDGTKALSKDVLQTMRDDRPEHTVGVVRLDQAVSEALAHGLSIVDYDKTSRAYQDILTWVGWITRHSTDRHSGVSNPTGTSKQ